MELLDLLKSRDIRATKEIELKGELAGCKITIRPVTTEEWQSARARSIKISKTGEPSVDQIAMGISLMIDGCVVPNFRSTEVLGTFTVPEEFVKYNFKPGEIERIANIIMQYSGYSEDVNQTIKK